MASHGMTTGLGDHRTSLVYLHRDQHTWPLGFGTSWSQDELPKLHVTGLLRPTDRLTLKPETWQAIIDLTVEGRFIHTLPCPVRMTFDSCPPCPACGTTEAHEVEIPELAAIYDRYVLRSCAVCNASWEQQA